MTILSPLPSPHFDDCSKEVAPVEERILRISSFWIVDDSEWTIIKLNKRPLN